MLLMFYNVVDRVEKGKQKMLLGAHEANALFGEKIFDSNHRKFGFRRICEATPECLNWEIQFRSPRSV